MSTLLIGLDALDTTHEQRETQAHEGRFRCEVSKPLVPAPRLKPEHPYAPGCTIEDLEASHAHLPSVEIAPAFLRLKPLRP